MATTLARVPEVIIVGSVPLIGTLLQCQGFVPDKANGTPLPPKKLLLFLGWIETKLGSVKHCRPESETLEHYDRPV